MGEVEFNNKEDEYKVKIVDGGEYKEPGGEIRKPSQEEIDAYKIHRIVVMAIFGLVVAVLLLVVVILIATVDRCEPAPETKELPWWKAGVMYNIYPRSFKDSEQDDGVGDFKGIKEKLDYVKGLGINILYLSSIFKVDKDVDYGYSVIDFKNTNDEYGSLDDFKKLVNAAHKKDIKVVIEFVPSDTSIKHQWFKDSKRSNNSKQNWYLWRDDLNVSDAKKGSWEKDANGRYYLHQSNKGKADLNWDNADVKEELESVLEFWLDRGVDGFRVVSVARLFEKPTSNSDLSKIQTILNKWHNYTTKRNPDSILIGSSHPANLKLYGTKDLPGLDIVVNFKLVPEDNDDMTMFYTAKNFNKLIEEYIRAVPKGKWPSWALTSWVHNRVGSNVNAKLAKSLNVLLLTLPGTPIVFYGDEIGMKDVNSTKYPEDGNRSPMQWNTEDKAGFTAGKSTWFGAVGNGSVVNAKDDQLGIKKTFKEVVKLRADNPLAFLDGALANFSTIESGSVLAYTFKPEHNPRFVVAVNFGDKEKTVDLNKLRVGKGELKIFTSDKKPDKTSMDQVKVPAYAALVFNVTENTK